MCKIPSETGNQPKSLANRCLCKTQYILLHIKRITVKPLSFQKSSKRSNDRFGLKYYPVFVIHIRQYSAGFHNNESVGSVKTFSVTIEASGL